MRFHRFIQKANLLPAPGQSPFPHIGQKQVTTLPARMPEHTAWPLKPLMELEEQEMDLAPDVATEGNCGYLDQEGQQLEREEGIKAQKRGWGEKSAGTAE